MTTNDILNAIDQEISKLKQARAILAGVDSGPATSSQPAKRRGRPKGSGVKAAAKVAAAVPATSVRKALSPEAKARIAAAQVARWAAKRKATAAADQAAKKASAKPAKTVTKVAAKRPAKPAVKASTAKKASSAKKVAAPQVEVFSTSV
jgi:hypothetical protein